MTRMFLIVVAPVALMMTANPAKAAPLAPHSIGISNITEVQLARRCWRDSFGHRHCRGGLLRPERYGHQAPPPPPPPGPPPGPH
jgi:hypothetical protein